MKKLFYLSCLALLLSLSAFSQVKVINPVTNRTFQNSDLAGIYLGDSLNGGGGSGGCCLDTSFLYKQLELVDSIYLYGKQSANFNQITATSTNFSKQIDSLEFERKKPIAVNMFVVSPSGFFNLNYSYVTLFPVGSFKRNLPLDSCNRLVIRSFTSHPFPNDTTFLNLRYELTIKRFSAGGEIAIKETFNSQKPTQLTFNVQNFTFSSIAFNYNEVGTVNIRGLGNFPAFSRVYIYCECYQDY